MVFFSWGKKSGRNSRDDRKRSRGMGARARRGLSVEALEDRTLPAAIIPMLPAAVVSGQTYLADSSGLSPTVVQDPVNPLLLFEVNSTGPLLQATYSTDGGNTWNDYINPTTNPAQPPNLPNLPDPNLNANPGGTAPYAMVGAPSAAIDLNETIYITYVEQNATGTSGALVLQRFSFASGVPEPVENDQILDQWFGADPVLNPVIGVDNNVANFTDNTVAADNVQTDTMSNKAVYIAWSTANTAPQVTPPVKNFNPNVIRVIASADGGDTFTTPVFVSDGANISVLATAATHYTSPKIVFTQGSADGRVAGGQLVFVWADFGNNTVDIDASQPDGGDAATPAAGDVDTPGSTGPIGDAAPGGGGGGSIPTMTTFSATVNVADPNFVLADLNVDLSILDPHMAQLAIDLISPDGKIVHLLRERVDANGNQIGTAPNQPGVADAANMGELNGFLIGTVFDQDAARSINDIGATAPWTSDFRPDAGSLSQFNGYTAAMLTGTWQLVLTDDVNDGMTPPIQNLDAWSLQMSSYISNTGFGQDQRERTVVKTIAGSAQAPFPTVNGLSGPQGIGQGLSIAIDNTLGALSPYEGRLYVAYNIAGGVRVVYFDNLSAAGADPSVPEFNPFNPSDHTVGQRFDPTIAVDQRTGTVGVMYYDSNWDTLQQRSAQSFSTSIDGGEDWSVSAQFNQLKTATDAITGANVVIEPYAGNQGIAGALGFGDQAGLVMYAGHVVPMFASNNNTATSLIATAIVTIAGGPRILEGDMGSVINDFVDDDDPNNVVTYNDTFTVDGTREINGIRITFDRPIDVSTFDASQFKLVYRDTVTPPSAPGTIIPSSDYVVVPIDNIGPAFGLLPDSTIGLLAENFLITFNAGEELTKVGTYSYSVGNIDGSEPEIRDGVKAIPGAAINPSPGGVVEATVTTAITASPAGAIETGTSVTIRTNNPHGLVVGEIVTIAGVAVPGYNGTYMVLSVPSPTTFTYKATATGLAPSGGGTVSISIVTVTTTGPHNLVAGETVEIGGVGVAGYNGNFTILSVPTPNSFTYTVGTAGLAASGGGTVSTLGNFVDQNQDAITGQTSSNFSLGDIFAIPTPTDGGPFILPYDASTLPLIIPGPYILTTNVVGQPITPDNEVLNGTNNSIDVTFDRDMVPTTLNSTNILRMIGPNGPIPFYTNSTPAPIPDGSGSLTSTITVTDSIAINDLAVGINISHADVTQLNVTLVAPDGTTIALYAGTGIGANLTNTIFDSISTTPITATPGGAPYTAVFRPAGGSLNVLNGKNYQGTWKLIVTDKKAGVAGTLNSWSLNPYTVTPNPVGGVKNRTFRITFGGQSLSGTYTIVLGPNSAGQYGTDVNGNQIDINHNAGLNLLRGGDPNNGTELTNTYTTGTVNTTLPAGTTVNIPINVTDSFLVQNVTLSLTIQHKSDPDLTATLVAPDGFSVVIFSGVGTSNTANFTNTTLSDAAIDSPIESAVGVGNAGIGAGPFAPENPLSDFKDHNSQGVWVLRITSKSSTLVGKLVNWSLNLTSSIPGSGLGEPIADQAQVSFRIFTQDPTNPVSDQSWTAVGPASIDSGLRSGPVNAIAVDPSDPLSNTVLRRRLRRAASGRPQQLHDARTPSGRPTSRSPISGPTARSTSTASRSSAETAIRPSRSCLRSPATGSSIRTRRLRRRRPAPGRASACFAPWTAAKPGTCSTASTTSARQAET